MFKSLLSYILGFFAGFYLCVSLVLDASSIIVAIVIVILTLALALFLSNKVHLHMKKKYDNMIKSGKRS